MLKNHILFDISADFIWRFDVKFILYLKIHYNKYNCLKLSKKIFISTSDEYDRRKSKHFFKVDTCLYLYL